MTITISEAIKFIKSKNLINRRQLCSGMFNDEEESLLLSEMNKFTAVKETLERVQEIDEEESSLEDVITRFSSCPQLVHALTFIQKSSTNT